MVSKILKIRKIVWILLSCFLIRLISLSQSLWLDEAISANVVKKYNFLEIVKNFSINDFHPPLYYWVLKIWTSIFGFSEISLRFPSIIFCLVTIYFVYLIGKKIKDEKTGLWSAAIAGFNPLLVYYSQEARMYALATCFLTISLYFFIQLTHNGIASSSKTPRNDTIILFNIFSFLSFASFYGSIFLIAAFGIYFLIKKKFKLLFLTSIGTIIAVLILMPLLKIQIINSKLVLAQVVNWKLVLGNVDLKNLLLFPIKFTIGRISFYPKIIYYLISITWAIIIFWNVFKGILKSKIFGFLFIMPLILGIIFSIFSPLMQYFRFLYLISIMCLLIVFGAKKISKKAILLGFIIFSFAYLLNSNMWREDWKSLANSLNKNEQIYMISSFSDPIKYYKPEIKTKDLKTGTINEKEVSIIPYGEEIHGLNHREKLKNYKMIQQKNFRGLTLETWLKTD